MKIIYFGNGPRGVLCLRTLIENGYDDVAVVGHPCRKSDVVNSAKGLGLMYFHPEKVNEASFVEDIAKLQPELIVLSGYNQILHKSIIEIPNRGTINLHGGKLPEYRGAAPINWQIINGETVGGCSIIYVDKGIDTGDIIAQEYYNIGIDDDVSDIVRKTLEIFPKMLISVLEQIENNTVLRIPQKLNDGCYYARRFPKDGRINWSNMSAIEVYNKIRALTKPYPGAFTYYDQKKISIWKSSLLEMKIKGQPGRISFIRNNGVVVFAKDRGLLIENISIDGQNKIIKSNQYFKSGDDLN